MTLDQGVTDRALNLAKRFWWWEVRIGLLDWFRTLPSPSCRDHIIEAHEHVNTFFDPSFLDQIPDTVRRVSHFDPWLRAHLQVAGRLRAWEYGVLLHAVLDLAGKKMLDAGVGGSTFCAYCASLGANVVALDRPDSPEKPAPRQRRLHRRHEVRLLHGDVMALPIRDASFDIVVCVSVLEHLGDLDARSACRPSAAEAERLFAGAIREIARVLRPGGCAYLTFEVCDRRLQKTDGWAGSAGCDGIRAAYDLEFVGRPMLQILERSGLFLDTTERLDPRILHRDETRQNYRGRYISTVCLLTRKPAECRARTIA